MKCIVVCPRILAKFKKKKEAVFVDWLKDYLLSKY